MEGVGIRTRYRSARRRLDPQRIADPQLRTHAANRWNRLTLLAAVIMFASTWPVLGETLAIPAYVLPVLALATVLPVATIAAGRAAVRFGWVLIVVVCLFTSLLPREAGHDDLRVAVPQFLVLIAVTFAALVTQPLGRVPVIWAVTAVTLLFAVPWHLALGWIFGLTVLAIGVAFLRYSVRSRREIAAQAEQTELAQAREEVLAERARIARELHDIVAHRMSMVVVMAQTARYRLAVADPEVPMSPAVVTEFESIAVAARDALDEVRGLLGVLRTDDTRVPGDDAAPLAPAPELTDLDDLIGSVRAAGAQVDVDSRIDADSVGGAAGLVLYRIVQESLSNALRHAPGAPILVTLEPAEADDRAAVRASVLNDPPGDDTQPAPTADAPGLGIAGMTERATALGGTLTAAPTAEGGFAVTAVVPVGPEKHT